MQVKGSPGIYRISCIVDPDLNQFHFPKTMFSSWIKLWTGRILSYWNTAFHRTHLVGLYTSWFMSMLPVVWCYYMYYPTGKVGNKPYLLWTQPADLDEPNSPLTNSSVLHPGTLNISLDTIQWRHNGFWWCLKSPASRLFTEPFIQLNRMVHQPVTCVIKESNTSLAKWPWKFSDDLR